MVVDKIDGGFVVVLAMGFFEMVVGVGFSWWFLQWLLFCGFFFFFFFEKLLWLLLVVGLVVFLMGFGGWHGGGYCDYGGGC